MATSLFAQLDGPVIPLVVAVAFVGAAAYFIMRDQSADLRAMLAAAPSPPNSLKFARAVARMYGDDLAQCIDFTISPARLRLHEGQLEGCASKLRKLARFGPSDAELEHNMMRTLNDIVALTAVAADVDLLRRTAYDPANPKHEAALEELWALLQPRRARTGGLVSKDWTDLGFQGTDPSTDFRGMGYFSLLSLVELARMHPDFCLEHVQTYMCPGNELTYFPFAITSINITGWVLDLLKAGELDQSLVQRGLRIETVHAVHHALFVHFAATWERERPRSVMDFGRIQKLVLADVKKMSVEHLLDVARGR